MSNKAVTNGNDEIFVLIEKAADALAELLNHATARGGQGVLEAHASVAYANVLDLSNTVKVSGNLYPSVNSMNLDEVDHALAVADINYRAVKPKYRPELSRRIEALRERRRRLIETDKRIEALGRIK